MNGVKVESETSALRIQITNLEREKSVMISESRRSLDSGADLERLRRERDAAVAERDTAVSDLETARAALRALRAEFEAERQDLQRAQTVTTGGSTTTYTTTKYTVYE